MQLTKVNLIAFFVTAILSFFLWGPFIALGMGMIAVSILTFWNMAATKLVLKALNATRLTDASADSVVYRLFLKDANVLRQAAGLPLASFYIVESDAPLAFSMGTANGSYQIVVTDGVFKTLTRLEVSAVIGHELGHIKAGDSTQNALSISLSILFSHFGERALKTALGRSIRRLPTLSKLFMRPDYRADKFSVELCKDATLLASALQKMERGVRSAQWNMLDKLPSLAAVTVIDPFDAEESDAHPEYSETAFRVAEIYRHAEPQHAAAA